MKFLSFSVIIENPPWSELSYAEGSIELLIFSKDFLRVLDDKRWLRISNFGESGWLYSGTLNVSITVFVPVGIT